MKKVPQGHSFLFWAQLILSSPELWDSLQNGGQEGLMDEVRN